MHILGPTADFDLEQTEWRETAIDGISWVSLYLDDTRERDASNGGKHAPAQRF